MARVTPDPGESEDTGKDWADPAALTQNGDREPTEPWTWAGPARTVAGRTWGGCIEVVQWILTAGRFPADAAVVCVGMPFGHTRPQWVLPYGGEVTVDGVDRKVWADYR